MPAQAGAGAATSSPKLCPGNSNGGPTISDPPGASFPEAPGHMDYRTSSINYVGNGHWLSMLENVRALCPKTNRISELTAGKIPELSEVLRERKQDFVAAQTSMSRIPNLLSGSFQQTDRAEILAAIPSRNIVDTLISEAFVNTDNECSELSIASEIVPRLTSAVIVHPPTFRKEYMQFWADPASTPIMWIGLLFTLMCLAIQYQQFSPDESRRLQIADANPDQLVATFHMKAAQCLFLGRYLEGPKYTVETLLLHLFAEHLEGDHTETTNSCWALWGLIVRIALRSGYHRDGSHFPSISPFEAELRRRTWAIIIQWDNFLSTQFCLPRMIVQSQSDTAEPRNLMEEDFDNNMLELPPARPVSAKTNAQFHTDKNRLLSVAGAIADLSGALRPPPIAEVLRLDDLLTETYESVAPLWQSDGAVVAAQTARYTQRASGSVRSIFLASIYCRAQITLHQRYLVPGKTIAQYARFRKTCIDAALTMLQHQWTLYLETQVGGPLCRHGWKFLSLLTQDFLFATALLCAELALDLGGDASSGFGSGSASSAEEFRRQISEDAEETRSRVFHSLSSAYIVWLQSRNYDSSRAVRTMVAALKELLRRAQGAGYAATKAPSSATVRRVQSQGHASTMATPDSLQDPGRWGGPSESYHSIALFPI
ncbi:hypothetical protein LTR47_010231 [Exophiala xenobiotica]|nr:hypothetical protein LTR47_010231 [Exophiala xenobiotica]KAK5248560.1 hypothetical protein LTS06_006378 [Exophiala xenobiotica]KAK5345463.1 hypothetical protein LTR61_010724 [Exophiala xenobiotica]KAK5358747.1 hypothetical protein LTR11_010848 [Exophiala xenobiotica]KAK5360336.1 hypothetical protein LTS03_010737 [Exophiala xenobiotica]